MEIYYKLYITFILQLFIKGPGLVEEPGVAHMGGKTPTRLVDSCGMYLEADEMAIYESWLRANKQVIKQSLPLPQD